MINDQTVNSAEKHRLSDKKLPELNRQICIFPLGEENYGVRVHWVLEVLEPQWFTIIPHAPSVILGAINHHGKIYTILNLSDLLGGMKKPDPLNSHIVLINESEFFFGFMVDRISEITYYSDDILKGGFESLEKRQNPFVRKIFRYQDQIINIVDVQKIINHFSPIIHSR
jgi:purine-binding chemotaxis protein CheW